LYHNGERLQPCLSAEPEPSPFGRSTRYLPALPSIVLPRSRAEGLQSRRDDAVTQRGVSRLGIDPIQLGQTNRSSAFSARSFADTPAEQVFLVPRHWRRHQRIGAVRCHIAIAGSYRLFYYVGLLGKRLNMENSGVLAARGRVSSGAALARLCTHALFLPQGSLRSTPASPTG
jgi:hypothetical protein